MAVSTLQYFNSILQYVLYTSPERHNENPEPHDDDPYWIGLLSFPVLLSIFCLFTPSIPGMLPGYLIGGGRAEGERRAMNLIRSFEYSHLLYDSIVNLKGGKREEDRR